MAIERVENLTEPGADLQDGDEIKVYHTSGATEIKQYHAPGSSYTLDVLVNGNPGEAIVAPGDTVTIDVTALKDGSKTTDFDGAIHRVPILDVDGSKAALIKVTIQDGTASATFTPGEAGIYTVDTAKIYPAVTQASIPNQPVVIAE